MEDQFKRLASTIGRVLNISEATVADAAESDEAIKELTSQFKAYRTAQDTAGYQRAEAKIKKDIEKEFKARGVEIPDLDKLPEGLSQLEELAREKGGTKLSDDDVLKHPAVVKLKNQFATEKEQAVTQATADAEKALTEERSSFLKQQRDAVVDKEARAAIAALNPVLSTTPATAKNQIEALVEKVKSGAYEVKDGKIMPLKPGTEEYLTNDLGHPVAFEDTVRATVTSLFDLPVASDRQNAGLNPADVTRQQQTSFQHFKGQAPKTEEEYQQLANDPTLPVPALKEVDAYWKTQSKAG